MAVWAQVTRNTDEIIKAQTVSMVLAKDANLSAAQASQILLGVTKQFGLELTDVMVVADALNEVQNTTGVSVEKLGISLNHSGGAARAAGVSFQQAAAMAAVLNIRQVSAERSGTFLKTLFASLIKPQAREAMLEAGLAIQDMNGQFLESRDMLTVLADNWQILTRDQKENIALNLTGVRQYTNLSLMLDGWNDTLVIGESATNSQGSAMTELGVQMGSVATQLEILNQRQEELTRDIGEGAIPAVFLLQEAELALFDTITNLSRGHTGLAATMTLLIGKTFNLLGPLMMMTAQLPALILMWQGLNMQFWLANTRMLQMASVAGIIVLFIIGMNSKSKALKGTLLVLVGVIAFFNVVLAINNMLLAESISLLTLGAGAGIAGVAIGAGALMMKSAESAQDQALAGLADLDIGAPNSQTTPTSHRRMLSDGLIYAHRGERISRGTASAQTPNGMGESYSSGMVVNFNSKPIDPRSKSDMRLVSQRIDELNFRKRNRYTPFGDEDKIPQGGA